MMLKSANLPDPRDPGFKAFESFSRRGFVRLGLGTGLHFGLGGLINAQPAGLKLPTVASSPNKPVRACILIFQYGGPSHIDTFDPKPNAPPEIRGEFQTIGTPIPGLRVTEHLPRLARLADKFALIRSVTHSARLHDSASIHALTGRPLDGPDRELFAPLPQVYPTMGSAVARFVRDANRVPFAALPFTYHNVVPTPSQGGGILGTDSDPLRIEVDSTRREYAVASLAPYQDLGPDRQGARWDLFQTLSGRAPSVDKNDVQKAMYKRAYDLLANESIRAALDLTKEPECVRERYGYDFEPKPSGSAAELGHARQMRGQNLLIARRLVEAGVNFVQVNDFKQQGQNWDAHADGFRQHREALLPMADRSISALIEDLEERGLLDSTLVMVTGEFGRTPKINASAGRDHWPDCYTVLMAGGGVRGGAVYGSSDRQGAYPATFPVTPGDLSATVCWRFGIDPATEIHDQSGRPVRLAAGEPLERLFS